MRKVFQTKFGKPHGNCLQACIASVLNLDLDTVPNFVEAEEWYEALQDFLAGFGLEPAVLEIQDGWVPEGYHLISGMGPRGLKHSVVGHHGEMMHDPYPDGGGLVTRDEWIIFVATLEEDDERKDLRTGS